MYGHGIGFSRDVISDTWHIALIDGDLSRKATGKKDQ
jgi:hypothetical protein